MSFDYWHEIDNRWGSRNYASHFAAISNAFLTLICLLLPHSRSAFLHWETGFDMQLRGRPSLTTNQLETPPPSVVALMNILVKTAAGHRV